MKTLFSILVFLLLIPLILQGQEQTGIWVKYKFIKRNGSHLIGEIVEKTAEGPYKIKLDNGVVIEMREYDLMSIKPIPIDSRTGLQIKYIEPSYKWGFGTELMGVSNGIRNIGSPKYATGVGITVHRHLSSILSLGGGIAMYNYDIDAHRVLFPFYGESNLRFFRNSSTPVLGLKIGYGLASKNFISGLQGHQGGMFINPSLGYEFGTTSKISWIFGIGVILQRASYSYENGTTFADENILFRRTEFKLGLEFH